MPDPFDPLHGSINSGHLLVSALKRNRDAPALVLGDVTLTGAQMADEISKYIQAFIELVPDPTDGQGMLALNRPEVLLVIGAGQLLGTRRTALHPLGSLDDHAYVLADAKITTLVIDPTPQFVERAAALVAKVPTLTRVLTLGPVPVELAEVGQDLVAAAAGFAARPLTPINLSPDHINGLTYTGGTTGKQGCHRYLAVHSHHDADPAGRMGVAGTSQVPDVHSAFACRCRLFMPTLMKGGSMVVLPKFDAGAVLAAIEEHQITATMLVPSMIYALLDHPDSRTRDLSSLQTVYYGASAINPVRLAEAIERFGPIFAQYFGQSEAPMVISYLAKGDHDAKRLSSCGRPSAFLRTALLDENDRPVKQGEPGEICVAGPLVAGGYWGLPEQTAETFKNGWLRTGDVAREDEDGFWFIVDRTKDMIVTGGFNVFPREVEDVVAEHPSVAQVGVIGVPDEKWGEAVTAIVVLRSDASSDEEAVALMTSEIQSAVKERKGSVQSPKHVIVADSLPLTALGKLDKKALRQKYTTV